MIILQAVMTPAGESLEAAQHPETMEASARGEVEWLTADEALTYAMAATPLAFWRGKRGLTQKALGAMCGISQNYVAGLESGKRKGDPALFKKIAKALRVRIEDLIADE